MCVFSYLYLYKYISLYRKRILVIIYINKNYMIVYYDYLFTKHKLKNYIEILETNDKRSETHAIFIEKNLKISISFVRLVSATH